MGLKSMDSCGLSLTDEQRAVVQASDPLLAVTAYAGTGKTSTLKAFAASRPKERMLYLAFNRSMADESRETFKSCPNVEVKTFHGLAFKFVGKDYANELRSSLRVTDVAPRLQGRVTNYDTMKYHAGALLLEAFNLWLCGDATDLGDFTRNFEKREPGRIKSGGFTIRGFRAALKSLWDDSLNHNAPISHNVYLKLFQLSYARDVLGRYDRLLIDEAQDLNDCMIAVAFGNDSRKVFVGDPYQQIYAFNGAVNALFKAESLGAACHYLTQSFRCPHGVAALANQYLKLLNAPKPFRGVARPTGLAATAVDAADLVIARTNAGLFNFIAKGIDERKFYYVGGFNGYDFEVILDVVHLMSSDIKLINDNFIKKFKTVSQLEEYLTQTSDVATSTRLKIAKRYGRSAFELLRKMMERQRLSHESDCHVTTAHKIKGQERDSVILLDDFTSITVPIAEGLRRKALADSGKKSEVVFRPPISMEEFRLLYVSISRCRGSLQIPKDYILSDQEIAVFNELRALGFIETTEEAA
jgi:superfamily I DNA/RNA helicase